MTTLRAATRDGVILARRLMALGVAESTIYQRCRDGGPWRRLLPGVIMLSNGRPSEQQLVAAALLYGGPTAILTGLLACRWHGVRRGPEPAPGRVHMLVAHARQLRSTEFVVVERTRRLPAAVDRNGTPIAPVARACIDAARRMRSVAAITELVADTIQRGLCELGDLANELAQCGPRGSALPRAVLAEVGSGVRSAAELDAKRLWRRTGLPEPWWNASVYDGRGRLIGVADAWCDDVALAWEIDSFTFHLSPASYARTVARAARFAAAGALVVPTLPRRLRREPAAVVAELRSAYHVAAARPRPALRAVPSAG